MKKVLIISYFFPPCNFVGAERTDFWAKNLYKYGIYPIIITRCWNEGQKDIIGLVKNNSETHLIKKGKYEVYYVPIQHNIRDYLKNHKVIRKILTLFYQIKFYFFPKSLYYFAIAEKASRLLQNDKQTRKVIVSGRPFEAFYFGYYLKKNHPNIEWIPDYRDQWNTYQDSSTMSTLSSLFYPIEKILEKKWTSNADYFITVTENWNERISSFINKNGYVVINGFDDTSLDILKQKEDEEKTFNILYAGTLYPNQEIEGFVQIISEINNAYDYDIKLHFIGCEMIAKQEQRLRKLKSKHCGKFEITERQSKNNIEEYLQKADILFLTGFENIKGWYPVKLFEYTKYEAPIFLYPTDSDIMEKFIIETNTGYTFHKKELCKKKIVDLYKLKMNNKNFRMNKNVEALSKYSRSYQTKKLAEILK